ncbi:hypothetical protein TNCT_735791 [Trichonephila clavata]|uniref:Uncharacterized protein n=1 Tax=Trichonephila clavata TaxID=2740835 RepID=A0A8X6I8I4_TRICU|nr:hypothetical protein TNCT_735791 [Trichonephila clavata]
MNLFALEPSFLKSKLEANDLYVFLLERIMAHSSLAWGFLIIMQSAILFESSARHLVMFLYDFRRPKHSFQKGKCFITFLLGMLSLAASRIPLTKSSAELSGLSFIGSSVAYSSESWEYLSPTAFLKFQRVSFRGLGC